jgi:hypothetical protein
VPKYKDKRQTQHTQHHLLICHLAFLKSTGLRFTISPLERLSLSSLKKLRKRMPP